MQKNLQLKALSMSVAFALSQREKEFSIHGLTKQNADICFLQETYSTKDIEKRVSMGYTSSQ